MANETEKEGFRIDEEFYGNPYVKKGIGSGKSLKKDIEGDFRKTYARHVQIAEKRR